jgi:hypothetical protein
MIIWIIFGATVFIAIVFLISGLNAHTPTREETLQKLAAKWKGKIEPLPEAENSYRMTFVFEGQEFIFEDRECQGFNGKIYRGTLRSHSRINFNMYFVERERTHAVRSDITIASNIAAHSGPEVVLPSGFKDFRIITSRPFWAQSLLNNKKVAAIFQEFKNIDQRGSKAFSIKIIEGEVMLEFHPTVEFKPNIPNLRSDPDSFESYILKVDLVINALRKISEDI